MSAIAQKIEWAKRAIDGMSEAEATGSRNDFQYHFGTFIALIGALRHFISVDPHKQWVHSLDEQDLYYCSCIDLRSVKISTDNAANGQFFVVVDDLPPAFTEHSYTHEPRPTKLREVQMLRSTRAVEIAEKALDFYVTTVLPGARSRGIGS